VLPRIRSYLANRSFHRSLLNCDLLELDSRAFHLSGALQFHYAYRRGHTLSTEVYRDPRSAESNHSYGLFTAIADFHQFLETQSAAAFSRFVKKAYQLLGSAVDAGGWCAIPRFEHVKQYGNHHMPWVSCHSQGWALSVFARAYQATADDQFLDAARGVMRSFTIDIANGGVRDREKTGGLFFEEYPFPGKARHVLNGFITAMLGIHEYCRVTGDRLAQDSFDEGIATLSDRVLDTFDAGHTCLYDQVTKRPDPPSYFYTKVHARQLAILHRLTGSGHFLSRAKRWQHYTANPTDRFLLGADCLAYRIASLPRYLAEFAESAEDGQSIAHRAHPVGVQKCPSESWSNRIDR
jgi:hypothetical protein